jgi:hypothetical protein
LKFCSYLSFVDLILVFIYFSPHLIFHVYGAVDVVTGGSVGFGSRQFIFCSIDIRGIFCADLALFYFLVQTLVGYALFCNSDVLHRYKQIHALVDLMFVHTMGGCFFLSCHQCSTINTFNPYLAINIKINVQQSLT